jgi:hypothetical protein
MKVDPLVTQLAGGHAPLPHRSLFRVPVMLSNEEDS